MHFVCTFSQIKIYISLATHEREKEFMFGFIYFHELSGTAYNPKKIILAEMEKRC